MSPHLRFNHARFSLNRKGLWREHNLSKFWQQTYLEKSVRFLVWIPVRNKYWIFCEEPAMQRHLLQPPPHRSRQQLTNQNNHGCERVCGGMCILGASWVQNWAHQNRTSQSQWFSFAVVKLQGNSAERSAIIARKLRKQIAIVVWNFAPLNRSVSLLRGAGKCSYLWPAVANSWIRNHKNCAISVHSSVKNTGRPEITTL